jgi:hypothetical protein
MERSAILGGRSNQKDLPRRGGTNHDQALNRGTRTAPGAPVARPGEARNNESKKTPMATPTRKDVKILGITLALPTPSYISCLGEFARGSPTASEAWAVPIWVTRRFVNYVGS